MTTTMMRMMKIGFENEQNIFTTNNNFCPFPSFFSPFLKKSKKKKNKKQLHKKKHKHKIQ